MYCPNNLIGIGERGERRRRQEFLNVKMNNNKG